MDGCNLVTLVPDIRETDIMDGGGGDSMGWREVGGRVTCSGAIVGKRGEQ